MASALQCSTNRQRDHRCRRLSMASVEQLQTDHHRRRLLYQQIRPKRK